jgi:hypothetical protein
LRTPDGTVTTFSGPGATRFSEPIAINPAGAITGFYSPATHGNAFLRAPDGAIIVFNAPGAALTFPSAINPAGAITGAYLDANGQHGFLRLP